MFSFQDSKRKGSDYWWQDSNMDYASAVKFLVNSNQQVLCFESFHLHSNQTSFFHTQIHKQLCFFKFHFTHQFLQLCNKLTLVHFKCRETRADLTLFKPSNLFLWSWGLLREENWGFKRKILTSMSGLYLSSNTAIAASDPEPMATELGHYFSQCISIQYFLKKEIKISSTNDTEVYTLSSSH